MWYKIKIKSNKGQQVHFILLHMKPHHYCIIVFYFIDFIFDSASGRTIKIDWLIDYSDAFHLHI